MDRQVAVYAPRTDFIELSRTAQGRVFRKHILTKGDLRHPVTGDGIDINDEFLSALKTNFERGICDIVQIPLAGARNEHTEDPTRNIGEVIGVEVEGDKVYALLDVRDPQRADQVGKTLLGASAMLHTDYTDTSTGQKVGPTLLHVAVTNRPYITGLEEFRELIAATAESSDETVLLTQEESMDLEQLLTALKNEHGIDVRALMDEVEQSRGSEDEGKSEDVVAITDDEREAVAALSNVISALETSGVVELSAGIKDPTPVVEALVEKVADLEGSIKLTAAETKVDSLIQDGRIVPATRDGMVALCLSDPELFDSVVPVEPLVKLSQESGTSTAPEPQFDLQSEIDRLTEVALETGYVRGTK